MLIHDMEENWRCQLPRWSQQCLDTVTKKNDNLMVRNIETRENQYWCKRLHTSEIETLMMDLGYAWFRMAVQRNGSNIAMRKKNSCYFRTIQGRSLWNSNKSRIDEIHTYSIRWERVPWPQRKFVVFPICSGEWKKFWEEEENKACQKSNWHNWIHSERIRKRRSVDRYTSHVIFLTHFTPHDWYAYSLQGSRRRPNVSVCALHSSFMSSTMCAWAFVVWEDTNFHDRFLRDPVYRESQLTIGWTEQVQSVRLNCKKRTIHIISLQRNRGDTKDDGISPRTSQSKSKLVKLRSDFRAAVSMKNRFSSFWQILHANNIRLLEDKIQNWGMYLSTIYFGSYAVDQIMELVHSVDDLKSSLSKKGTHGPKLWVARCENSFITVQNHQEYLLQ